MHAHICKYIDIKNAKSRTVKRIHRHAHNVLLCKSECAYVCMEMFTHSPDDRSFFNHTERLLVSLKISFDPLTHFFLFCSSVFMTPNVSLFPDSFFQPGIRSSSFAFIFPEVPLTFKPFSDKSPYIFLSSVSTVIQTYCFF